MLLVNESRECGVCTVVELAAGVYATRILGRGDDFEVLVLEVLIDGLPPGQIKTAASPRGPGENQHLLPAEIGQLHEVALAVG